MAGTYRTTIRATWIGASLVALANGCQTSGPPRPLISGDAPGLASVLPSGPPRPLFGGGERGPGPGQSPVIRPAHKSQPTDPASLPKELVKVTMPPYMVEAPDVLLIDAKRLVPLPPYKIAPLDVLFLSVPETRQETAPEREINGPYPVQPDGTIELGPDYGAPIRVVDLEVPEAQKLIQDRIREVNKTANVSASLAQAAGAQQIRGEHLIQPDGTVSLGLYGSVYVAGMTTPQVKEAIEAHLAQTLYKPEVSVTVSAYNSKFYYVITDFAGNGDQVQRIPATGNETVLDAISLIGGLSPVSSKQIWVARPAPEHVGDQILPVDWKGISRRGSTATNYQILPGDRVYVMAQPLTKIDTAIGRALAPVERLFGTVLIGSTAVQTASGRLFGLGGGVVGAPVAVPVP